MKVADFKDDYINYIMDEIDKISYIDIEDIPNIDLYMDQVTTFMDRRLSSTLRDQKEDKVLTKTMINNYAKNKLIPSPEKKKYSREHIILLLFVYYFKGVLTISDIQELLDPLTNSHFECSGNKSLSNIYNKIIMSQAEQMNEIKADIENKSNKAKELFDSMDCKDSKELELFLFISLMNFDVYYKKLMIEKVIDNYLGNDKEFTKKEKSQPRKESVASTKSGSSESKKAK